MSAPLVQPAPATRGGESVRRGWVEGWRARGGEMALPSAVPERPSALKLLVLFFRRCFLRLACGDGGGSILGLVVLEMLGLEQTESPRPVSVGGRAGSDIISGED